MSMSAAAPESAPILSTPDEHIFEDPTAPVDVSALPKLSDEELYISYEIQRTVAEIKQGRRKRIALQFADEMLMDAPRVFEFLQQDLRKSRETRQHPSTESVTKALEETRIDSQDVFGSEDTQEEKLTILADTSYGACCVDEIAAEHVDADVVVHYGRSCLSPTARLPVIYVFTTRRLEVDAVVATFEQTYTERQAKIILMADIPYQVHVPEIAFRLQTEGYSNLFAPSVIHDPSSPLPNRTVPAEVEAHPSALQEYALYHISDPPPSLLLNISSRVSTIHIHPTTLESVESPTAVLTSTAQMLRRRYALVTRLSTVSVFGILINTLSVKNYMTALAHVKDLIARAGKKAYTFVVGKVNAAKVANFSEVGGWIVIGCWESSLIESKDFWKPIITPFELELALTDEKERLWTGEWNSNFQALLGKTRPDDFADGSRDEDHLDTVYDQADAAGDIDSEEESEPPVFDLRTGKYISQSRPMARPSASKKKQATTTSLIKRANGDLAQIGGEVSPAAEFLRSKRTWQGLGSDYQIAYEYDDQGKMQGAQMEQGRSGVAKGYNVGESEPKT